MSRAEPGPATGRQAKLAWRNLWRNKRRSLVTLGAMAFALWVLVLYSGLITGYLAGMERDILDLEVGDLQIHAAGYQDNPSLHASVPYTPALLTQLAEAGLPASARWLGGGLAAAGTESAGVALRGLDVASESRVSRIHEHVATGAWLDAGDPHGAVLGRALARTLNAKLGDEVVVLSQAADGSMANDLFTVRGVLHGVSDGTDRTALFINAATFRELMAPGADAHQIVVRRPADMELAALATRVRDLAAQARVQTWRELMPTVASMLEASRAMILIISSLIYIAVAILVLNAMLMAVHLHRADGDGPSGDARADGGPRCAVPGAEGRLDPPCGRNPAPLKAPRYGRSQCSPRAAPSWRAWLGATSGATGVGPCSRSRRSSSVPSWRSS